MNAPRRLTHAALALAFGLVLAPGLSAQAPAPAAAPALQEAAPEAPKKKPRRNSSVLTTEEIQDAATSHADGFSLVQSLRPSWLRRRGVSSINRSEVLKVYVDGMPVGSLGELRRLNTNAIDRMEYLDGTTATQRYGTDHGAGAILVRTRG